jgi:hypothetical protein
MQKQPVDPSQKANKRNPLLTAIALLRDGFPGGTNFDLPATDQVAHAALQSVLSFGIPFWLNSAARLFRDLLRRLSFCELNSIDSILGAYQF